jgi:hypothetical protein
MTYRTMTNKYLVATATALNELLDSLPDVGEPDYDESSTMDIVAEQLAAAAELERRQAEPFKFTGMTDSGLACYEGVV